MTSTNGTRSTYVPTGLGYDPACICASCSSKRNETRDEWQHEFERPIVTSSWPFPGLVIPDPEPPWTRRDTIVTVVVLLVVAGLIALLAVDTSHAVEVARSSWGHAAAILRSHLWG